MDGEEIRSRLSQMVTDFEVRSSKVDGLVSGEALTVVKKLVDLAKETVPDDPNPAVSRAADSAEVL